MIKGIELRKKYPIKIDVNSWNINTHNNSTVVNNSSNLVTMQYLFTPESMTNQNENYLIINDDNAKVVIKSDDNTQSDIILKGTVSTATATSNDYVLVFSKAEESFHLHDVGLSINGLKRDRQDDFSEVRNRIETSSEIKAKMNKRLKSSNTKPKIKPLKKTSSDDIPLTSVDPSQPIPDP